MCPPSWRRARVAAQQQHDLALLRRARDRIDRDSAEPPDVEALARIERAMALLPDRSGIEKRRPPTRI